MPVRDKAYRSYMSIGAKSIALFKQFAMDFDRWEWQRML